LNGQEKHAMPGKKHGAKCIEHGAESRGQIAEAILEFGIRF